MFDYLLHGYGAIALYLYALLDQYLPQELATVLAAVWPGLLTMGGLAAMSALFTWQDRRAINRRLNERLEQVRQQANSQDMNHE